MKDTTKLTITGLFVLVIASIPAGLFIALWNFAMNHVPATEPALKIVITLGCILLGGWVTFLATLIAASLALAFVATFSK